MRALQEIKNDSISATSDILKENRYFNGYVMEKVERKKTATDYAPVWIHHYGITWSVHDILGHITQHTGNYLNTVTGPSIVVCILGHTYTEQ